MESRRPVYNLNRNLRLTMPVTNIHRNMRRCLLSDEGVVTAYLDPDNSYNITSPTITGVAKSGTAGLTLSDPGAFSGVQAGQYVHNTTLDVYFQVLSNEDNNELSLQFAMDTIGTNWGKATSTSASKLVDSGADFTAAGITIGMIAAQRDLSEFAVITSVSATELGLSADIFESGDNYSLMAGFREGDSYEVCTAVLDGSAGQVMVEIPKFYFRHEMTPDNRHRWLISDYPIPGYVIHPAFNPNGVEVDHIYYSAFEGVINERKFGADLLTGYNLNEAKLGSYAGFRPVVSGQRSEFRQAAGNRGSGWQLQDWYTLWAVQLLFMIEYEDLNSQSVLGPGLTDWNSTRRDEFVVATSSRAMCHTGWSLKHGNASADNALGNGVVGGYNTYRGIENFWGNIWKWTDGYNQFDGRVYLSNSPSGYDDDVSSPPYIDTGKTSVGGQGSTGGYISKVHNTPHGFLVEAIAGGSGSYLPDYYWYAPGWRVAHSGGHVNDGATAGFAVLTASASSFNRFTNTGSRVCFRG